MHAGGGHGHRRERWCRMTGAVRRTHGESGGGNGYGAGLTKEYAAWQEVKRRCYRKTDKSFKWYGGRGISMCQRWRESYAAFLEDMGRAPSRDHSIDRIDNNGNYTPDNCRWATRVEQARNTRWNLALTVNGITATCIEWAERTGIRPATIRTRKALGWSDVDAVTKPVRRWGRPARAWDGKGWPA